MAKFGDTGELLKCSFCGKSQKQVKKLIAGPGVYICDECIDLCNEIIEEELADADDVKLDELPKPAEIRDFLEADEIFSTGNIASGHGLRKWSEGYWKMLEAYARVMADHRQNVVLTPLILLVGLFNGRNDIESRSFWRGFADGEVHAQLQERTPSLN